MAGAQHTAHDLFAAHASLMAKHMFLGAPFPQFNLMACIEDRRQKCRREIAQQQHLQVSAAWQACAVWACTCCNLHAAWWHLSALPDALPDPGSWAILPSNCAPNCLPVCATSPAGADPRQARQQRAAGTAYRCGGRRGGGRGAAAGRPRHACGTTCRERGGGRQVSWA